MIDTKPLLLLLHKAIKRKLLHKNSIIGFVDSIDCYRIHGWAIHKKNGHVILKCRCNGKDYSIQPQWTRRIDIAHQYGASHLYSGFKIDLPDELSDLIKSGQSVQIFANNVLLKKQLNSIFFQKKKENVLSEEKQSLLLDRHLEKLNVTCTVGNFSFELKNYGLFRVIGNSHFSFENTKISIYSNGNLLECSVLKNQYNEDKYSFEIILPAYIWQTALNGVCYIQFAINGIIDERSHFELTQDKALAWVTTIIELPDFSEKQYWMLLSLEHLHYGGFLNQLSEKNLTVIRNFASDMKLTSFLFSKNSFDQWDEIKKQEENRQNKALKKISRYSKKVFIFILARFFERNTTLFIKLIFLFSKSIFKITHEYWLNTAYILYLIEAIQKSENKANVDDIEKFHCAIIFFLESIGHEWFSRLHDQNLIDSMVFMLANSANYSVTHRLYIITAAQRLYGLNPTFWEKLQQQHLIEDIELKCAESHFQIIFNALNTSSVELKSLDKVIDSLIYFNDKNNVEVVFFIRELTCNLLNNFNESSSLQEEKLLTNLLINKYDALRIAAFPLAKSNTFSENYPEIQPEHLKKLLRSLNVSDKSNLFSYQEQLGCQLAQLFIDNREKNQSAIENSLRLLQEDAFHLNNIQGGFLAFDILSTAYSIASRHRVDCSFLLDKLLVILQKAIEQTDKDYFLSVPILAGLCRLAYLQDENHELVNFMTKSKLLISTKFEKKFDNLLTAIPNLQLELNFSQDTLVIIYSCRKYLPTRVAKIRQTWLNDLKQRDIPYLIVVGDGNDTIQGDILALNVSDRYEDLPQKSLKLFNWLYENTNAQYVLKIDDDCYLNVGNFFDSLSYRKHFYYGRQLRRGLGDMDRFWHQEKSDSEYARKSIDKSPEPSMYADGGGAYTLSRWAMLKLLEAEKTPQGKRLIACSFMEDKLIGDLLALSHIESANEDYALFKRWRTFAKAMPVSMWDNSFFPSQASPTQVTHLDSEHDFELTHARVSSKELWPKKIWPTYVQPNIKSNSNQLELLTDTKKATHLLANHLQVICVVRNEMIMLPHFLTHYRQLGVKSFIFVDNCSNDGSREYLYNQHDVVLYSVDTDYKHSHYGVAWQQAVLGNHCLGKWVLIADADELFIFANCEHRTLNDFTKDIEQENANASRVYMIDMYPKGDLDEADFTKQSPFTAAAWFDNPSVIPWSLHSKSGCFSNSLMTVSCLRHRLVPHAAPHEFVSQKYALFRYAPWQRFSEGLHCATNLTVSKQKTYFAHFKYHVGFKAKVATEIHRGQHFNNAAEYKYYSMILNESKDNFYQTGISQKYTTSADFYNTVRLE